jgi:hypothetical protein
VERSAARWRIYEGRARFVAIGALVLGLVLIPFAVHTQQYVVESHDAERYTNQLTTVNSEMLGALLRHDTAQVTKDSVQMDKISASIDHLPTRTQLHKRATPGLLVVTVAALLVAVAAGVPMLYFRWQGDRADACEGEERRRRREERATRRIGEDSS